MVEHRDDVAVTTAGGVLRMAYMLDRENEVREMEALRCAALVKEDFATLASIIADDVVHIHSTGVVDDKNSYLEGVSGRLKFLKVHRSNMAVKIFGDIAVATGTLDQTIQMRDIGKIIESSAVTTQVWARTSDGEWRQTNFHSTRSAPLG
jgi:ketosteroid isomerase-like protein